MKDSTKPFSKLRFRCITFCLALSHGHFKKRKRKIKINREKEKRKDHGERWSFAIGKQKNENKTKYFSRDYKIRRPFIYYHLSGNPGSQVIHVTALLHSLQRRFAKSTPRLSALKTDFPGLGSHLTQVILGLLYFRDLPLFSDHFPQWSGCLTNMWLTRKLIFISPKPALALMDIISFDRNSPVNHPHKEKK